MEQSFKFVEIPISELTTPKEGYEVMLNRWWCIRNGNVLGAKFPGSKDLYPQCNGNEEISRRVSKRFEFSDGPVFIPVAYWPNRG